MCHLVWLQNRTPACALNGKTPYEERHKKKPHLAEIQEFGVTVYVKNLTAGKPDSRARLGHFVRYDSESKGYRIYWPDKWSIMVEQNIIFNESDVLSTNTTALIPGDALDEGEKEKVIQPPQIQHTKKHNMQPVSPIAPDTSDTMASDDPLPGHISNDDESAQLGRGH